MGLDVAIRIKEPANLPQRIVEDIDWALNGKRSAPARDDYWPADDITPGFVYESFIERFYGPGYERGNWPIIAGVLMILNSLNPGRVYYGSDAEDMGQLVTPELLAEITTHYLGQHGDDYHARAEEWNREAEARRATSP